MNISAASRASGLPVKTRRYCADIDLVSTQSRTESGYRTCDDGAVLKLVFVRRARGGGGSAISRGSTRQYYGHVFNLWPP